MLTDQIYKSWDLVEQDRDTAPSLDLPDIVIEKFFLPADNGRYMLFYANTKKSVFPSMCPCCKTNDTLKRAGNGAPRLIHDVERNNYRVDIILMPKRFECTRCGVKITPSLRGIEEKRQMTTRLLEFLQKECLLQSHTNLAQRSGFTVETIQKIMDEEIAKFDAMRKENPLPAPRVLGIDEKHITHKMRGTLVDVENGRLLDMMESNDSKTMQEAIKRLKDWDNRIEVVTTDMNNAYLCWLPTFLPNATVVIDKFHVIQNVQKRISNTKTELYEYRKNLIKQNEDVEEKARQRGILSIIENNPRLFNYNMESIVRDDKSEKALKLSTVMNEFPEFRLLREMYYAVEVIYQKATYEEALRAWDDWMELLPPAGDKKYKEWCDLYSVTPPLFNAFRSLKRSGFQRFKPYILNHFKPGCRETNAATEGVNTMIERINRDANGLSFRSLRSKSLYASLVNERKRYGVDLSTIRPWRPTKKL